MRTKFLIYLFLLMTFSSPAHAYLDPGTFSLVIQSILAGLLAFAAGVSNIRNKVTSFFSAVFRPTRKIANSEKKTENDSIKKK